MRAWCLNAFPSSVCADLKPPAKALVHPNRNPHHVAVWLLIVCALIYMVIAIGGYTRLSGSGLSMVDWKPVTGVLPPLTQSQWQTEFDTYKQFPEYRYVNQDMTLDGFKTIFWVEYLHRVAGRLVALVFLLPLLYFWIRGYLSGAMRLRLVVVFMVGGLQGLLGWYMVKSGLVSDPSVSQYRLTAHLGLAVLLYSYILWLALSLLVRKPDSGTTCPPRLLATAVICVGLVAVMLFSGGFMAGTHAGFIFNTFPQMNGEWIPDQIFSLTPFWLNLLENTVAIQFFHRWMAVVTITAVVILWLQRFTIRRSALKVVLDVVLAVVLIQFMMGVATLISQVELPIALIHQSGSVLLLTCLIAVLRLAVNARYSGAAASHLV